MAIAPSAYPFYCPADTVLGVAPVAQPTDPAQVLLEQALKIVTGARRQAYGTPEDNFGCIAALWNCYLLRRAQASKESHEIDAADVAVMMILMKCARLAETPNHVDSAQDVAGYAACLHRIQVHNGAELAK